MDASHHIRTTDIVPGPGGVMTDEVGVVTGELTLRSELAEGKVVLRVQYKDAEEWYAVTGGMAALNEPSDLDAVHAIAVGLLHRPEG
jgi:F0F1-type ATP synthase epsilon subunit